MSHLDFTNSSSLSRRMCFYSAHFTSHTPPQLPKDGTLLIYSRNEMSQCSPSDSQTWVRHCGVSASIEAGQQQSRLDLGSSKITTVGINWPLMWVLYIVYCIYVLYMYVIYLAIFGCSFIILNTTTVASTGSTTIFYSG